MRPLPPEWARTAAEWRAERDKADPLPAFTDDPWVEAERRNAPKRAAARAMLGEGRAASAPEAEGANAPRFRLIAFNHVKPDEGAHYLIKGFFPRSGVVVVWGPPKCGKSFWIFDLLMHVALGWEYRGNRVTPGPVVYCALEGALGFKLQIEAFRQAKLSKADPGMPPFYLMPASLSLARDRKTFIEDIRRQLGNARPVAVCIDTLNRSLEGSESSDADMAAYICAADAIRYAFDCRVIIVHHCGHDGTRPRGHSESYGCPRRADRRAT